MNLDENLLSMLGCPLEPSRPPFEKIGNYLVCRSCQTAFPIVDGIPHLLPESGRPISEIPELNS